MSELPAWILAGEIDSIAGLPVAGTKTVKFTLLDLELVVCSIWSKTSTQIFASTALVSIAAGTVAMISVVLITVLLRARSVPSADQITLLCTTPCPSKLVPAIVRDTSPLPTGALSGDTAMDEADRPTEGVCTARVVGDPHPFNPIPQMLRTITRPDVFLVCMFFILRTE
jgi:hypothetical protein